MERIQASFVELGCGQAKREGFFGIDVQNAPGVDLVLDFEKEPLPFEDGTVDKVYSSHTFEHLCEPGSPIQVLREIVRVSKHNAEVEIWTPYGKSNDGLLLGHRNFYTEAHWEHICYFYDSFYLGPGPGRFIWYKTQYVLNFGVLEHLERLRLPLPFAIDYLYNVVKEFGVFLRVDKTLTKAPPLEPLREFCDRRGNVLRNAGDEPAAPGINNGTVGPAISNSTVPLRYRIVDSLNNELKKFSPLHSLMRSLVGRLVGMK
jgi:hypothetical protein